MLKDKRVMKEIKRLVKNGNSETYIQSFAYAMRDNHTSLQDIVDFILQTKQYNSLKEKMTKMGSSNISLSDHAEMWSYETSGNIPEQNTKEWQKMYESWIDFAFADSTS